MLTRCTAVVSIAVACALAGCSSDTKHAAKSDAPAAASAGMLNDKCPFSGEAVNPQITSAYKAGKVGFCCAGCKAKWDTLSDERRAAMLATTAKAK